MQKYRCHDAPVLALQREAREQCAADDQPVTSAHQKDSDVDRYQQKRRRHPKGLRLLTHDLNDRRLFRRTLQFSVSGCAIGAQWRGFTGSENRKFLSALGTVDQEMKSPFQRGCLPSSSFAIFCSRSDSASLPWSS